MAVITHGSFDFIRHGYIGNPREKVLAPRCERLKGQTEHLALMELESSDFAQLLRGRITDRMLIYIRHGGLQTWRR